MNFRRIKILIQNMKFNKLITKAADETVDAIEALGLVEDVQVLRDTVEDFSFARIQNIVEQYKNGEEF